MTPWESARRLAKCGSESLSETDKLFWFGQGGSPLRAEKYCSDCPIIKFCQIYAIVHDEEGIWGGTTKKERNQTVAAMPSLKDSLTEKARREGWLEERLTEPIFLPVSYSDSTQSLADEDKLFDKYLSTLQPTGS